MGQLSRAQMDDDWGHEVSGLVLRYDQNVLLDSKHLKLENGLLYYPQTFHCPTSIEHLELDCMVEYTKANNGFILKCHNM